MPSTNNPQVIAITGSTGFVGSHLVRSLSSDGHDIKAFGRVAKPPKRLLDYAEYHQWNITKPAESGLHGKADIFIHTAGFVNFWGKKQDMYQANVVGTQNSMELAQKMGARTFIYMSSGSVYDPLADKINVKEPALYAKRYLNYYAVTKTEAEQLLLGRADFDQAVIIRPHAIYGPGDRTLVPQILSRVTHRRFILPDSGKAKYSVSHVGNIVDAVRGVLGNGLRGANIFNICDLETVEALQFLKEVLRRSDQDIKIMHVPYVVGLVAAYILEGMATLARSSSQPLLTRNIMSQLHHDSTMDIGLARRLLGYEPRYSCKEGLDETLKWVEDLGGHKKMMEYHTQLSWSGKIRIY